MRFEIEEGVVDCKTIKVLCKDANGNICKEKLPIFTDALPKETLAQLLEEILTLHERFESRVVQRGPQWAMSRDVRVVANPTFATYVA